MILLLSMVMGMSPASAAITEVDLQIIPQKQPRWMMGDGSLALSALSTGYTSWGSVSASVDLQFAADFETTPSLFLVSATPVYSLQRLLNRPIPILGISDYGVFAQVKGGLSNSAYQPVTMRRVLGGSLSFGGGFFDILDLRVGHSAANAYTESYELSFGDGVGGVLTIPYEDSWTFGGGVSVATEWYNHWTIGKTELFTRGFVEAWTQPYESVEQWPDDRPGESFEGPTWLAETSPLRVLAQPSLGIRFGKRQNLIAAIEFEMTHNVYTAPRNDLSVCVDAIATTEGIYCLAQEAFTLQVGPMLGVQF